MKKKIIVLLWAALFSALLFGCDGGKFPEEQITEQTTSMQVENRTDITENDYSNTLGAEPQEDVVDDQIGQTDVGESNLEPLYEAFLKNEITVSNPYVEDMQLTVMDDENYETEGDEADIAVHEGEEPEWFELSIFEVDADVLLDDFWAGEIPADGNGHMEMVHFIFQNFR
uniref:hypothetical protein n=1 Tax=Acetatifactor sp. TaxID=1872090 RepID=UPI0040567AA0